MWLWIVVAVAAVMHAAVISDEENRRIRNAKEEIFVKYSRIKEEEGGWQAVVFLFFFLFCRFRRQEMECQDGISKI